MAHRPRSLQHEYELFVEREIENYKESVPRRIILGIGDEAVASLEAQQQLALTELLLCEEVDRIIRARLEKLGLPFDLIYTEYVGATATHGPLATIPADLPEVQLRIGVRGNDRKAIERFTREIAPLVLTGPPGVTGYAGGRPKIEDVVAYWPALVDKRVIAPSVSILTT